MELVYLKNFLLYINIRIYSIILLILLFLEEGILLLIRFPFFFFCIGIDFNFLLISIFLLFFNFLLIFIFLFKKPFLLIIYIFRFSGFSYRLYYISFIINSRYLKKTFYISKILSKYYIPLYSFLIYIIIILGFNKIRIFRF